MTEQIHRAKINKSNDRTNTQNEDKECLSSLCVFVLSFDLFIFALCICSVIWLVYLRSVYFVCQSTCLSSLCVFGTEQIHRAKINKSNDRTNTQSEDKQVEWQNKYTERRKTSWMTDQIDLFIFALCICSVIWLVYLRSVYFVCQSTCLSSLCVFGLSFNLFFFALCICSVILTEQIHRTKINKSNDRTNTQSEDKQVEWQNKYTERR
jgi:uncharacterized ion transporter superfamily protein YfcC